MPENSTIPPTCTTPPTSRKKKVVVLGLTSALLVLGAGAAFAYWTTDGTGSGEAKAGPGLESVSVVQTSPVNNLRPGGAPIALSGHFINDSGRDAYVGTLKVTIEDVVKAVGAPAGPCDGDDYTLSQPAVMAINANIISQPLPSVSWGSAPETVTIGFNNKPNVNQDGCKGATVNLVYTVG